MLRPCPAPSPSPSIFAFGLTWGYLSSATPIVNKDCLLCSPFPRWTEVEQLLQTELWEASLLPFFKHSLCEGKVL